MCKKTASYVVWTGTREKGAKFSCDRHLGEVVLAALLNRRAGPVKVAIASCDDAPCEMSKEAA